MKGANVKRIPDFVDKISGHPLNKSNILILLSLSFAKRVTIGTLKE